MNAVHRGFILRELVKRDFQSRYVGSALGVGWAILHPFWQLLLFTFIFGMVLKIAAPAELTGSFAIFLFAGLVPWIAIQEGINRSATAITDNAMLIGKLRFPPEMLVASCVVGGLIQSLLAGLVLLVALIFRGELEIATLPWLLFVIPFQILLTAGLGLLFAAINVFLRDVSQVLTIVTNAWFYFTPIVYPVTYLQAPQDASPLKLRAYDLVMDLILLNPLTAVVELYRHALMGGAGFKGGGIWVLSIGSCLVFVAGWTLFRRLQPGFADEL